MYTSPEEARSDLFLAGAMYLFGPLLLGIVFDIVPVGRIPGVRDVVAVALPLVTTALVPYLLIRHRKEPWSGYGFNRVTAQALGLGAFIAIPMVIGSMVVALLSGGTATMVFDPLNDGLWGVLSRMTQIGGVVFLAVYVTVKARDAFRQDYVTVREGLQLIGRWVAGISLASLLLLGVAGGIDGSGATELRLVLMLAGLVGSWALAVRGLRGPSVTSRQVMLTPTVLLALGPFALSLSGARFLSSVWQAGFAGGMGLLVAVLLESKRSAWTVAGFALTVAAATLFILI